MSSQDQQPVELLYPPITRQPESSHSNGSFGPVFIVLAVIVVISVVACVLGRLCSGRLHRVKEVNHHHQSKPSKKSQGLPKEWESRQKPSFNMNDGDIEFGFEKRIPSVKNGGGKGKPPHHHHHQQHHHNGGHKPEVRFADNV